MPTAEDPLPDQEVETASTLLKIRSEPIAKASPSSPKNGALLMERVGIGTPQHGSPNATPKNLATQQPQIPSPQRLSTVPVPNSFHVGYQQGNIQIATSQIQHQLALQHLAAAQAAAQAGNHVIPKHPVHSSLLALLSGQNGQQGNRMQIPFSSMPDQQTLRPSEPSMATASFVSESSTQEESCPPKDVLRPDEIQAALQSKPQRGRKRVNLSELERQELTRTRNREHAKCTRIRKKMRYQELLNVESELNEMKRLNDLLTTRRQAFMDFISVRESMIRTADGAAEHMNQASSDEKVNSGSIPLLLSRKLEDVLEDSATFHFGFNDDETDSASDGIGRMLAFDRMVATRVKQCYGPGAVSQLAYSVKGGRNGVALDSDNGGYADVAMFLPSQGSRCVISFIVRFRFHSESVKLCSVLWTKTADSFDDIDRLTQQVSHPSVVSLDPNIPYDSRCSDHDLSRGEDGDDDGPGLKMGI